MGNFHTAQLDQAATPEQREAWSKALEAEQRRNGTAVTPAAPSVTLGGKVIEMHSGSTTGQDKVIQRGVQSIEATPGLKPGHIFYQGVETTIDAAVAGGLMSRAEAEAASKGFNQPAQLETKAGAGEDKAPETKGTETASEASLAAKEAGEALDTLDQTIGAQAVDAALEDVVEGGYLPDDDNLPEGVSLADVIKVHAGYVAQANTTLADVGASVPMLMETLSDDELREARRATIKNDPGKMQELGRQAVERLAQLPTKDPHGFAEMVAGMSPAERKVIHQNDRGEWIISIPGKPVMSYGAAVRMGLVRI